MINKKNLWFLTLFSLVLVLSIYYVTMPSEMFDSSIKDKEIDNVSVNSEETSVVSALKVEDDGIVMEKMNSLKEKLTNSTSTEEKNSVFEELKKLNKNSSKEETLENKVKEKCSCENFVKIEGDNIRVVLDSSDSSVSIANDIMRVVQSEFDEKKYISVKFNE